MATWLREKKGFSQRQLDIADACYANDFGCTLEELGLRETIKENRLWDAGVQDLAYNSTPVATLPLCIQASYNPALRGTFGCRRVVSCLGSVSTAACGAPGT